ncbi:MAG TPA: hypothetical protein VLC08_15065 [Chitinolyticbacter sp.]|uniref:hypothetical protein n=1 Tax=Chitinolyticbacter albus TaxID=2961951 RepID=UPI00210A740A|nr:hypothetical protein [Chitinolyticbacter albus]HSC81677.1 hypothetical protein [Chitinolyticbacter sp.]
MSLATALRHPETFRGVFPAHADLHPHHSPRGQVLAAPGALPGVHRVDVTLQKPFDHDTGMLYDPDNTRKAD